MTPFLRHDTVASGSPQEALAAIDEELRMRDQVYPRLIRTGKLGQAEAERRYRGMVGARRLVLEALQLALPFGTRGELS